MKKEVSLEFISLVMPELSCFSLMKFLRAGESTA